MYTFKTTLADFVNNSSDKSGGNVSKGPYHVTNSLNQDIEVFLQIKGQSIRGAGSERNSDGSFKSKVYSGKDLPLDTSHRGNSTDFKYIYRMNKKPAGNDAEGIKIIPGSLYGPPHHIEFVNKSDGSYELILHYEDKHAIDVDPEIEHPDG